MELGMYIRRMMPNFLVFINSPIIPLRLSPLLYFQDSDHCQTRRGTNVQSNDLDRHHFGANQDILKDRTTKESIYKLPKMIQFEESGQQFHENEHCFSEKGRELAVCRLFGHVAKAGRGGAQDLFKSARAARRDRSSVPPIYRSAASMACTALPQKLTDGL